MVVVLVVAAVVVELPRILNCLCKLFSLSERSGCCSFAAVAVAVVVVALVVAVTAVFGHVFSVKLILLSFYNKL